MQMLLRFVAENHKQYAHYFNNFSRIVAKLTASSIQIGDLIALLKLLENKSGPERQWGILCLTLQGPAPMRWFMTRPIASQDAVKFRSIIAILVDHARHQDNFAAGNAAQKRWNAGPSFTRLPQRSSDCFLNLSNAFPVAKFNLRKKKFKKFRDTQSHKVYIYDIPCQEVFFFYFYIYKVSKILWKFNIQILAIGLALLGLCEQHSYRVNGDTGFYNR